MSTIVYFYIRHPVFFVFLPERLSFGPVGLLMSFIAVPLSVSPILFPTCQGVIKSNIFVQFAVTWGFVASFYDSLAIKHSRMIFQPLNWPQRSVCNLVEDLCLLDSTVSWCQSAKAVRQDYESGMASCSHCSGPQPCEYMCVWREARVMSHFMAKIAAMLSGDYGGKMIRVIMGMERPFVAWTFGL